MYNMVSLKSLKLNLKQNMISERGMRSISYGLSNLKKLEFLDLRVFDNKIGKGTSYLLKQLGELPCLTTLNLFIR